MIRNLAYTLFLGQPLIMYAGILTYLLLLFTALVGYLNLKSINIIPFQWHRRLAVITLITATIHALFGLSAYFNF